MNQILKKVLLVLYLITVFPSQSFALSKTWEYKIDTDTSTMIDSSITTAEIDTVNNEIRLPKYLPSAVSFWPSGELDFVCLGSGKEVIHYSYDQASNRYKENQYLSVSLPEDPLAVVATAPYPDKVVITKNNSYHFSFNGTNMVNNSLLTTPDLNGIFTLGAREKIKAGLIDDKAKVYSFDGASTERDITKEPNEVFDKPIDLEIFPDRYGITVGERDKIRTFLYDTSMHEVSSLSITTGIINLKDISLGNNFRIAAIVENTQKEWQFDQSTNTLKEITMLGITSGLSKPKCVALHPQKLDRIILDDNEYKYYRWNGSRLEYDSSLSVTVNGLETSGFYSKSEIAVSKPQDTDEEVEKVRVRAYHTLPNGTSATWSVTADGLNWVTKWRVRGTSSGTVAEVFDSSTGWTQIGNSSLCTPHTSNDTISELYADVNPGKKVQWKVLIETNDTNVTPIISPATSGGIAVKWEAGNPPNEPSIEVPGDYGSCFITSTPTIEWEYSDPDNDPQLAYQIIIKKNSDGTKIYDSGKRISAESKHRISPSNKGDSPGVLWSSGTYKFTVEIKAWDTTGLESDWCTPKDFCVVAFDRPRIAQIVSPPDGQVAPDPDDASTHIVLEEGTTEENLPKVKAGARVKLLVDSIGPIKLPLQAEFPYLNESATLKSPIINHYVDKNEVNRWEIDFWTNANLEICPSGTIVHMKLKGDTETDGIATLETPNYAKGVIITKGSIYEEWFTVVQGRD